MKSTRHISKSGSSSFRIMTGKLDSGRFFHNRRGFSLGKDVTGESLLPSPFAIEAS